MKINEKCENCIFLIEILSVYVHVFFNMVGSQENPSHGSRYWMSSVLDSVNNCEYFAF